MGKSKLMPILFLSLFVFLYSQDNKIIDYQYKIDSLRYLSNKFPERGIRYAREILKQSYNGKPHPLEHKILNSLGEIYLQLGLNTEALTYFIDAEAQIKLTDPKKKFPWLKINIGNVYYQQEKYIKAREYYLDAFDIFSSWKKSASNTITGKSVALSNLGRIEKKIKNYDKALDYFLKALDVKRESLDYQLFLKDPNKVNKKFGVLKNVANQHLLIAYLYIDWGQPELAMRECEVVDSLFNIVRGKMKSEVKHIFSVLGNNYSLKTYIYTEMKDYKNALKSTRSASQLLKKWPMDFVSHMLIESEFYIRQDSLYLALEALDRGIKTAMINGLMVKEIELLTEKMKILEENNLEMSAVDVGKKIISKNSFLQKKRMNGLFESIEYKSDLILDRENLKDLKTRQLFMYLFLGVILIGLGFVIISFRNKRKFIEQKVALEKNENKLIAAKLKNKEDELINLSAYIVSKNELLNSILDDIDYQTSLLENKNDQKILEPLQKRIQSKIDDAADWDQFQMQFTSAHPFFMKNLKNKFPDLKVADIKLCCYLKMNMSTKEIARINGLSVRAVENKRYRLRKKLSLNTDTSLESFVESVED